MKGKISIAVTVATCSPRHSVKKKYFAAFHGLNTRAVLWSQPNFLSNLGLLCMSQYLLHLFANLTGQELSV